MQKTAPGLADAEPNHRDFGKKKSASADMLGNFCDWNCLGDRRTRGRHFRRRLFGLSGCVMEERYWCC